jgi:hypothetical protein
MASREPFTDPVIGPVEWDENRKWWRFTVETGSGQPLTGLIDPCDEGLLENGKGLEDIRELVSWVMGHEPDIRQRITDAMFPGWLSGWYDEEIDEVTTAEGFRETISLAGFNIDTVSNIGLTYRDGGLFGGHMIVLNVDLEGRFVFGPDMWG